MASNRQKDIYKDFDIFSRAAISANDVDSDLLILKDIGEKFKFEPWWFSFMFCSFDSVDSAIQMCKYLPNAKSWSAKEFIKLRKEIKGFGGRRRGSGTVPECQARTFDKVKQDLEEKTFPLENSKILQQYIQKHIPYFGETQAYKVTEVIHELTGLYSIGMTDLGIEGKDLNSRHGVVGGLRLLFGQDKVYDTKILPVWETFAVTLADLYNDKLAKVETCICEYSKLHRARTFVGLDASCYYSIIPYIGADFYIELMQRYFHESLWVDYRFTAADKKMYRDTGIIKNAQFAEEKSPVDIKELINILNNGK